jgi:hypothetical protein
MVVSLLLAAGFCGWLVHQTARFFSQKLTEDYRSRVLRALFEGLVFWAGFCLFVCLLMLVGSLQARWKVATAYYWVAAAAGIVLFISLGAAEVVHRRLKVR